MLRVPDRVEADLLGQPRLLDVVGIDLVVGDPLGGDPLGAVDTKAELQGLAPVWTIVSFICTCSRGTRVGQSDTDGRGCAGDR